MYDRLNKVTFGLLSLAAVLFLITGVAACSEGCNKIGETVDYQYRQERLTEHRVGNNCVVVFYDSGTAAIAPVPCTVEVKP